MAADFFERQGNARRNTKWLVAMFVLAVVGVVGTTFVAAVVAVGSWQEYSPTGQFDAQFDRFGSRSGADFPWHIPVAAAAGSLLLIIGGTGFKTAQLAAGGTAVAERVGGRRVFPDTIDPAERRVLNVVEEMALASGVPVPPVYVLQNEQGINAFAAGFSPSDAVVGVTRGCVEKLSRDQLQGVIAHEFSHILNGDMRLNIRLIGVLHGILLLGLVGRELLYAAGRGAGHSRRGNGGIPLLVIGLAMLIIGFFGTFIGNLIKAAVSRQREFLADASAVQFTRNPEGIAGALKRIGAAVFGSRVMNPHAAEVSHMYFSQGVRIGLSGLLATHPPLERRIRLLDPQWDGKFPARLAAAAKRAPAASVAAFASGTASFEAGDSDIYDAPLSLQSVEHAADQIGHPTEIHREYVHQLVAAMSAPVVDAVHESYGARAVIYATLLDRNAEIRKAQLSVLEEFAEPDVYRLTRKLIASVDAVDVRARLPLVDMALPALRALSPAQYQSFSRCFVKLVQADKRLGMFEWVLHQILLRHLRPQFEPVKRQQTRYYGLQRLGEPCSILLSSLARASQGDVRKAFDSGAQHIADVPVRLLAPEECKLSALQNALQELAAVAISHRARLISACAATICSDAAVNFQEAELLRAICDLLDCPMPPLVAGQSVSPAMFQPQNQQRRR